MGNNVHWNYWCNNMKKNAFELLVWERLFSACLINNDVKEAKSKADEAFLEWESVKMKSEK